MASLGLALVVGQRSVTLPFTSIKRISYQPPNPGVWESRVAEDSDEKK